MILCERYDPATGGVEEVPRDQAAALRAEPDAVLLVDLQDADEQELSWLGETFGFHPLAMEDVRTQGNRAKFDRYDRYYFFALPVVRCQEDRSQIDSGEVDVFVGSGYLVFLHQGSLAALAEARRRWQHARPSSPATPFLFYVLLDAIVDSYFPLVDQFGDLIDDVDTAVFSSPDQESLRTIFTVRRSLLAIRKLLGPLRDALSELMALRDEDVLFLEQVRAYLLDVFDHVLRLTDFVDTYRDMLSGSLDAYQSSLANRLNQNMQRLTVAATVLATATAVTGFYGMNLEGLGIHSPWPHSGQLVLGGLGIVTLLELWLFRRKGWI